MNYNDTLMWKELNEAKKILADLREKNAATLQKIASAVRAADVNYIATAARGTSDHAMMYLKYLAESSLGLPVSSAAPSAVTMYGAKMNFSHALVVGCSQSGRAADVSEVIKAGNASGAVTVSITNDAQSPLAKLAQYHLDCNAGPECSVAATKTFTCQLFLSALLVEALGGGDVVSGMAKALADATPVVDAATDPMAAAFIGAQECFVLGRGVSAAVAFECGLKLQETCYIRARAYHSSDFYHGPMAMVGQGTKVILFAPRHSSDETHDPVRRADSVQCARKMKELGADLYIVTDDVASFADLEANVVCVPSVGSEAREIFVFALTAQMLACKVSCGKGLSPDTPRALKKVTVTM